MQQKNLALFFLLTAVVWIGWMQMRARFWPQPVRNIAEVEPEPESKPAIVAKAAARGDGSRVAIGSIGAQVLRQRAVVKAKAPESAPPTPSDKLIKLGGSGGDEGTPRFHLDVDLDPRGAGVRRLVLNKFAAADKQGRPIWRNKEAREHEPLELLPAEANRDIPSFLLYHYDTRDPLADHPLDTLGRAVWTVVDPDHPVRDELLADGRHRQQVAFQTEIQGVTLTKIFSLIEGEYHLGLEVHLTRKAETGDDRPFRYQLLGGHGLPLEGEWYTNNFRTALTARLDHNDVYRDVQDLRQITSWQGGKEVVREPNRVLSYAGVAVQYFASVIAVDSEQGKTDFLLRARPTLESAVSKGKIKSITENRDRIVLAVNEKTEESFYVPPRSDAAFKLSLGDYREGMSIALVTGSDGVMEDGKLRAVALDVRPISTTQQLFLDDIAPRVMTEPVELKPGSEVVHRYVLYNGPLKPMLLGQLTGDAAVAPEVVDRYLNKLHLNTLTDYHSPGWFGDVILGPSGWSYLLIYTTNLMHTVLFHLHYWIPNYGVCIILLTVLVRGIMFPLSRKQAITGMRMQELAPEIKKLQAKYKDDRQALGSAQMELYRKHNVNPFGSCWMLLIQMPIFMGLYYCLQESIHFRLAEFWPTWIANLAAPDMLIYWSESIPFISQPEYYGQMFYLGPYFNLLPIVAVTLMIVQQKLTMPPPTDEQQEMQQSMMKYMMVFMGLMFYKVAAGLCVYFIASSLWGFTERKLLPKKKKPLAEGDAVQESLSQISASKNDVYSPPTLPSPSRGFDPRAKRKKNKRRREEVARGYPANSIAVQEPTPDGLRGWWSVRKQKLAAWWEEVLRQAEKKR